MYGVGFIVAKTKVFVEKTFESYAECRNFVRKCQHSTKVILVYYPNFYE